LPYPAVRAIAQSADGYLWLAMRTGLGRFDGVRFTHYTSANLPLLEGDEVNAVSAGPDDTLWVGTAKGILWYKNGAWSRPSLAKQIDSVIVSAFYADQDGGMWIGASPSLFYYRGGGLSEYKVPFATKEYTRMDNMPSYW
jgi:ligand-binding sensor domain-containing protein